MSKFRVKMKLQGLELEIEGAREDAGLITRNLGQQFAGLMGPIDNIIDGTELVDTPHTASVVPMSQLPSVKRNKRKKTAGPSPTVNEDDTAIDFRHDPLKFGNAQQTWKTADKSLWLIYVLKSQTERTEFTAKAIADTFNKHFRGAGLIKTGNVNRDLERLRTAEKPSPLGFDPNKSAWFLTDEGERRGQVLVAAALGQTN